MSGPRQSPLAGGALLALAIVIGTIAGAAYRESSIGFVAGLGAGVLLMVLVYLLNRR